MPTEKKRMGRPPKNANEPRRISLGLKVTPQIKELIDTRAKASGRTQSQEAELMIERAVQYDRTLAAMNQTLEQIQRGNLEAELVRQGHSFERTEYGRVWYPPGFPEEEKRSGWVLPKETPEK